MKPRGMQDHASSSSAHPRRDGAVVFGPGVDREVRNIREWLGEQERQRDRREFPAPANPVPAIKRWKFEQWRDHR